MNRLKIAVAATAMALSGAALAQPPPAKALEPRAKFQVFTHAHFGLKRIVLGHVTNPPPHLVRVRGFP